MAEASPIPALGDSRCPLLSRIEAVFGAVNCCEYAGLGLK